MKYWSIMVYIYIAMLLVYEECFFATVMCYYCWLSLGISWGGFVGNYIWFQQAYCGMRRVVDSPCYWLVVSAVALLYCGMRRVVDSPCYWLVVSAVALRIYVSVGLQIVSVQFHLLILNKQFIFCYYAVFYMLFIYCFSPLYLHLLIFCRQWGLSIAIPCYGGGALLQPSVPQNELEP